MHELYIAILCIQFECHYVAFINKLTIIEARMKVTAGCVSAKCKKNFNLCFHASLLMMALESGTLNVKDVPIPITLTAVMLTST